MNNDMVSNHMALLTKGLSQHVYAAQDTCSTESSALLRQEKGIKIPTTLTMTSITITDQEEHGPIMEEAITMEEEFHDHRPSPGHDRGSEIGDCGEGLHEDLSVVSSMSSRSGRRRRSSHGDGEGTSKRSFYTIPVSDFDPFAVASHVLFVEATLAALSSCTGIGGGVPGEVTTRSSRLSSRHGPSRPSPAVGAGSGGPPSAPNARLPPPSDPIDTMPQWQPRCNELL